MGLSLRKSLNLHVFSNATVMGGLNGLHHIIDSVNVMVKLPTNKIEEVDSNPNISNWLIKNQLVLTTEHVISENIDSLIQFLQQMSSTQCAGLIIKANHHISSLPQALVNEANILDMPIIVLPNDNSLGEIMSQVLSIILNAKQVELERTFAIHSKFSRLFLQGASMSDVAQTLTGFIHHPIVIMNAQCEYVGSSATVRSWVESVAFRKELVQLIVNHAPARNTITHLHSEHEKNLGVYPIHSSGQLKGYFIVLNMSANIETFLMPLEQAAQIVAYESIKQGAFLEGSNRLREEFFDDFLENKLSSVDEILKRGDKYGLESGGYHWVVVCKPRSHSLYDQQLFHLSPSHYESLLIDVNTYLDASKIKAITTLKEDSLVLILTSLQEVQPPEQEAEWIVLLKNLQIHLTSGSNRWSTSFGISNPADQLDRIPRAFQEAQTALKQGLEIDNKPFIVSYRVQQVPDLIRLLPFHKLSEFYISVLKSLAYPKTTECLELLQILDTFLQVNCNVKQTANALFLHRNTVFYKLNKCENILNISLKDPVDLIKLRIALIIHQFIMVHEKTTN